MARIDCRWRVPPTAEDRWEDCLHWREAEQQAKRLPEDWTVNVGLGALAPVVIVDGAGEVLARLETIEFESYGTLAAFLRGAVPLLLAQTST
jgi:hypothetical protein